MRVMEERRTRQQRFTREPRANSKGHFQLAQLLPSSQPQHQRSTVGAAAMLEWCWFNRVVLGQGWLGPQCSLAVGEKPLVTWIQCFTHS